MIHRGTGRPEEALADLQRALDRDPRSAEAYRETGRVHQSLGRTKEAEDAFRHAAELRPSDWAVHNYLGALCLAENRLAEAEVEFRRVVLLTPDNPRGYTNLGAVCYQQGRLDEAETLFRRSVEIRPTAAALSNLGTTRFFLGRYEEAALALEEAVKRSPRDGSARLNLGRAYFVAPGTRGRSRAPLEEALALLEQETAVNPRDASLIAGAADAHAMLGHGKQARALSARAVALAPDDAAVLAVGRQRGRGARRSCRGAREDREGDCERLPALGDPAGSLARCPASGPALRGGAEGRHADAGRRGDRPQ